MRVCISGWFAFLSALWFAGQTRFDVDHIINGFDPLACLYLTDQTIMSKFHFSKNYPPEKEKSLIMIGNLKSL